MPPKWRLLQFAEFKLMGWSVHTGYGTCPVTTFSVILAIHGTGSVQLAVHVARDDIPNYYLSIITRGGQKTRWALGHAKDVLFVPVVLRKKDRSEKQDPSSHKATLGNLKSDAQGFSGTSVSSCQKLCMSKTVLPCFPVWPSSLGPQLSKGSSMF